MRIFKRYPEALNEIHRDVAEMGIQVHPHTWQDKDVRNDPNFDTLELQNYDYCVLEPKLSELKPIQPWADAEWEERVMGINGEPVNPGSAWKLREEVWRQFLTPAGMFGYSYSERFSQHQQVRRVIERAKKDPDSRQLYISVWRPSDVQLLGGISRVPCTLGYTFQLREGQLNMLYQQRSADLCTHIENDIYLAGKLHEYVCAETGYPKGRFTHLIMSLHAFRKDLPNVF